MADGSVQFGEKGVSVVELEAQIRAAMVQDRETRFVLRADRAVAYGKVVEVLDLLRRLGVQRLTVAVDLVP